MKWFDNLVAWLFPNLLVEGTPWRGMWLEKERATFIQVIRPFLVLAAAIYIAHYFFYDKPNHLEPLHVWLAFRVAMAGIAMAAFVFYLTPLAERAYFRAPAVFVCWLICYAQAHVALWHGRESWVFCYILIVACVLGLRMSALMSTLFACFVIATQTPVLVQAAIPASYIFTGSIIAVAIAFIVRASYLFEVRSFLLDQENISTQKRIIELNIEFAERIRSFIPRVIARRIGQHMEDERMSVLEASIEVLSANKRRIACLFSDIRGYTKESRDLEDFLRQSVLPEVKACTDSIEDFDGIPRKIGDLIFAYFDEDDYDRNLLHCLCSAMAVSRINQAMNATSNAVSIKRYVLLSCGDALVGNLGGLDSSIEITALGSPVNFLSRVDELTKTTEMVDRLRSGDLVLSEEFSSRVAFWLPGIRQFRFDLKERGLTVRDFPEVEALYILPVTDSNYESALRAINVDSPERAAFRSAREVAA